MNVGWIGLGKVGLPCALALAQAHEVWGYDLDPGPAKIVYYGDPPPREEGIGPLLDHVQANRTLHIAENIGAVVANCDVVFVCVQTPHPPGQGGETVMPDVRQDFEYQFLVQACRDVAGAAAGNRKHVTLVVVSTVMPGTISRLIRPLAHPDYATVVYSPALISLGRVVPSFISPPLVICGAYRPEDAQPVLDVYHLMHRHLDVELPRDRFLLTGMESAEMAKIAWNAYSCVKLTFANMIMEMCQYTGADCDEVSRALRVADDGRYLAGGTGPAGPCHPRDLAALSWLADQRCISYDMAGDLLAGRENQARWLAQLTADYQALTGLPVVVLGKTYKPGSAVTAGSAGMLLHEMLLSELADRDTALYWWDPVLNARRAFTGQAVYLVATAHEEFADLPVPAGSVVVDPHGITPDRPGVTTIRVGRR